MMNKTIATAAALTLTIGLASTAQADFVPVTDEFTLTELQDETLTVLDKDFFDFSFTSIADGGAVKPTTDGFLVTGGFNDFNDDGQWQFGEDVVLKLNLSLSVGKGQVQNITVGFGVRVNGEVPNALINDVALEATGISAEGTGSANISETVFDSAPPGATPLVSPPLSVGVFNDDANLQDVARFAPIDEIFVVKDIAVSGGSGILQGESLPGRAHISEIFQSFSQVPEPATVALLGLGGLVMIRRRK